MTIEFDNLHTILRSLYQEMMPLCSNMAGVAKGIAGLGALFYVAVRVWQSLARAEAIDVYPLLRPFAVGFCIMFFPTIVLGTINGVLSPVVQGTNRMLESQTLDMNKYREQKDKLYTHKCAVCGRTDVDHPELEFRYCSKCQGYHCFCSDHINNHIHFTE